VCLIYNAGELSLVEYGRNEVLGTCRTEYMSPFLISVRLADDEDNKKIAYLMDMQTVRILDLAMGVTVATINHDVRIDWLELNPRGSHLLFRDKKRQLHLYHLAKQERTTLLHYCSYVQWVPGADVIVAQNRGNMCVWYSVNDPEKVTHFPIKGEVEDIERERASDRAPGRTEVIVDEGINTVSYALDETLIEFGPLLGEKEYERAADLLEPLELTPETEALWQQVLVPNPPRPGLMALRSTHWSCYLLCIPVFVKTWTLTTWLVCRARERKDAFEKLGLEHVAQTPHSLLVHAIGSYHVPSFHV
jgi:intraflagellar transport protein 172